MYCAHCTTSLSADAATCPSCGQAAKASPKPRLARPKAAALWLALALSAASLTAALLSCSGGTKSAEAAYAAAARKAVERTQSLKHKADTAVANNDKAALKEVSDEIQVQYVFLQDLTPPPQLVEFHTTVVEQVFVIYDTAETIVVQDLPPQDALSSWEQVSAQWDTWFVAVWEVWVEAVSAIEESPPDEAVQEEEDEAEEAEVSDFDGDYEGEGTVGCSDLVQPEPFPLYFTVEGNQIVDASGIEATIDSSGRLTWAWAPDPTIRGDAFATFEGDPLTEEVTVEGTFSGTFSVPGPDYPAVTCSGSFSASRVFAGVE